MLNFGVFGKASRTGSIRAAINRNTDLCRVYGYCNESTEPSNKLNPDYIFYPTFEDMLADPNIDAITVSNCFCNHTQYVIKALDAGKHVISEITAGVTPKECVELCEAVERNHKVYALLENYALLPTVLKMKEEVDSGAMGKIAYAEGEYCHPMSTHVTRNYFEKRNDHWRLYRPCTFYVEHALGPLIYMLDAIPTSVFAKPCYGSNEFMQQHYYNFKEIGSIMLLDTDKEITFNVKGCTHWSGHGRYYRINGEHGGIEIPRGQGFALRTFYSSDYVDSDHFPNNFIEEVQYPEEFAGNIDLTNIPHQGSDIFMIRNFVDAIEGKCEPLFDVYKACAMSAVSIYGWRSILEGKEFKIPDFKDPAQRELIRNDDLNPFSINGSTPTLPCTK